MGKLYFKVEADYEKVIKLREEISKLKNELRGMDNTQQSAKFNSLNEQLGKCTKEMDSLVAKAAQGGAKLEQTFREAINGISSDPLKSFDAELVKMCGNLNKYFDELLAKMESMSSLLQVGKVSVDGSTSNNIPTQQLDELRSKNTELTEQLRIQKAEIKQQQEEWDKLAMAIKTNNVSAIEQYKQATNASSDAVKNAKTELKGLAKDLDENIKYFDKLTIQASAYAEELAKMQDAKDKGLSRVVVGAGGTSMPINDEIDRLNISLQEVRGNQKGVALEISNQKQRQTELNQIIEQGNGKHARTRTLIMDAREQLIQMRAAGLQNTAQYQQSAEELGKMRKQMVLVNAEMAYLSNPNKNLTTFKAGLSGIASSASLVAGVMGIFNQKNEEMAIIQTKIQSLLGIIVGLEGTYNMIKKSSILMLALENVQRKASIASQALEAKAKTNNIALTWSEVAAQKAFNLVAEANPYVLLATAILSVIGGIWLLVKANKEGAKAQEEMNKKMETAKVMRESYIQSFASTASSQMSIYQKLKKEYDLLGNSLKDKNKFILENQDSFHQLGLAVNGVSDAENIFINQSNAVTNAIMQRAKAAAIGKIAQEKWEQYFKERENSIALQSGLSGISSKVEYKDGMPTRSLSFDKNKSDSTREELDKSIDQNDEKIKALKDGAEKWSELQIEVENGINDILKQAGIGIYDKNTSKQENQAEKEAEKQLKRQEQLSEQLLSLRRKNQQDEINLMADGTEKKLAQIDLDYRKELDAIRKQEQEWSKANGGKLTEEQSVQISLSYSQAESKRDKSISDVNKEELEAMNRYLKEYGTFQQKKEAITKEYTDKIANANTEGDKNILQKEWEESISSLNMDKLKQEINWELVFGDLSKVSKKSLEQVKKQLKEFKNSDEYKNMSVDQKKVIDESLNNIQSTIIDKGGLLGDLPEQLDALRIAQDELKKAQDEYNEAIKNGTDAEKENALKKKNNAEKNVQNAQTNVTKSADKTKQNLITLADSITQLGSSSEMSLSQIGNLASGLIDTFTEAGSKIGGIVGAAFSLLDTIGKQGLDGFVKNVFSSVFDASRSMWDTITFGAFSKITGFGDSDKNLEKDLEYLAQSNQDLKNSLDNLSEKMDKASVADASDIYEVQKKNIKTQEDNTRESMQRSGAASKSGIFSSAHSSNYKINEGMSASEWKRVSDIVGRSVSDAGQFFQLSSEQMAKLAEEDTSLYSKIKDLANNGYRDAAQYMDEYITYYKQLEELENAYNEKLTNTSFDSVRNDFKNALLDMESDAEDFTANFEKMMQNAIVESLMTKKYDALIQAWYEEFANAMEGDGKVDENEQAYLQNKWNNITNQALAERDALKDAMGWESDSESSRKASQKGIATASQDSVDENNGRLAVIQAHTSSINENVNRMVSGIDSIANHTANLSCLTNIDKTMQSLIAMRDTSLTHLSDISNYTSNLVEMKQFMYSMKQDINAMLIKGTKIRRD